MTKTIPTNPPNFQFCACREGCFHGETQETVEGAENPWRKSRAEWGAEEGREREEARVPEGLRALRLSNVPRFSSALPYHHAAHFSCPPPKWYSTNGRRQPREEGTYQHCWKKHCVGGGKSILNEAALRSDNKYTDRALCEGRWLFMEIALESGGIKNGWFILRRIKHETKQPQKQILQMVPNWYYYIYQIHTQWVQQQNEICSTWKMYRIIAPKKKIWILIEKSVLLQEE